MTQIRRVSVVLATSLASLAVAGVAAAVLPGAAGGPAVEHTSAVTIPGPNADAGTHADGAPEAVADKTAHAATAAVGEGAQGEHGAAVSGLATSTTLTGAEKGAAIASLASDGRSDARGESADHAAGGAAKAETASAKGQDKAAAHRP